MWLTDPLISYLSNSLDYLTADTSIYSVIRGVSSNTPPYRSSGGRAHRKWKRARAAGRSK